MTNKEAIRILTEMPISTMSDLTFEEIFDALNLAIKALENERPKGEWIKNPVGIFICSKCGSGYNDQPTCMGEPMFEFCPCCGAEMGCSENG